MTIPDMCSACWIPQAINTHSEYVIIVAFPLQQWLQERASMLRFIAWPVWFTLTTDHLDTRSDPVHNEKNPVTVNKAGLP